MSWIKQLYHTYESISALKLADSNNPLTPVGHTMQNAHIEIVLDGEGNFKKARVMPAKTAVILPVTESSESRAGKNPPPHPLADKIQYVAKDYALYSGEGEHFFEAYFNQIKAWSDSKFTHPKLNAIFNYISKGTVIKDLINERIFWVDDQNKILTKWEKDDPAPEIFAVLPKTKGEINFGSALVCWNVEIEGDYRSETWLDETLYQSWNNYEASIDKAKGFCLIEGEESQIATLHPAKLRHTGDKAKLISSNDTSGYTFRGRFSSADESATISREISTKAHSALRWLIARQGIRNGDQATVAWAISGKEIPSPLQDSYIYLQDELDFSESTEEQAQTTLTAEIDWANDLGYQATKILKKRMLGFKQNLDKQEQISLLMLDSATPGRMALTYYQTFIPDDYFENLDNWIEDFSWYQRYSQEIQTGKKKDRRTQWLDIPPAPFAIAQAVYGRALTDTLKKQLFARLLPVIAGGRTAQIPYDLVIQSFQNACNPHGYEHWEWERNIGVACALYRGWCARLLPKGRIHSMSLEKENTSRDYLYGRLLAIAENIESYALYIAGDNKRMTTAERYMQRFAERPFSTWRNIELALQPYQERLHNSGKSTGKQAIDEIMLLFKSEDFIRDDKLSGEFLLGYHCQRKALSDQIAIYQANKQDGKETTK